MGGKMSGSSTSPVTAIIVGAGNRGSGYAQYAQIHPQEFKIIGVAEPRKFYRERLQKRHEVPNTNIFADWKEAVEREKFADCVVICTPDRQHRDPAIAFAKKGYHLLLEKPMAVFEGDCREIVKTCKENNVILMVCHVLRYTPWARKLKELIDSGAIGDVVNIQHLEPVGFWHFAHSYVRGNWHREDKSSFSLLAKCCHDLDLINYWMGKRQCTNVSSFGSLSHFSRESKPQGAASRCLDCPQEIESNCPYSAKTIYLKAIQMGNDGWPVSVITEEPTVESVKGALRTGPYGICVYDNDNDVMSNQVVNMQFTGGATASLTMMAFTQSICAREVKIFGTRGELCYSDDSKPEISHYDFLTRSTTLHPTYSPKEAYTFGSHGGADYHCIKSFVKAVATGDNTKVMTGPDETLGSHLLAFAAEKARKENKVVTISKDGTF